MELINCSICSEMISENAPTFKIAMGFGNFDEYDSIVVHRDCAEGVDIKDTLLDNFEESNIR